LKAFIPDECNGRYKISATVLNHITNPQTGQDGGWENNIDASWLNQGGGGGTGFHDQQAVIDGISNKAHAVCQGKSFLMKTRSIVLCIIRNPNSCEPVSYRKIYNGS